MPNFLSIVFLLFLLSSAKVNANGFVGNGGEGIAVDGRVFLLDLFSMNVHEHPFFGDKVDPGLPNLPPNLVRSEIDFPRKLLQQKLSDLNRGMPGLGDYLIGSMGLYVWVLVDSPLTPISLDDDPVLIPPGAELIQLANRLGGTIRISATGWRQLDDANKVALLIHEATYSLLNPVLIRDGVLAQSARMARELTASFFTRNFYEKPALSNLELLGKSLAIPNRLYSLSELRQKPRWSLCFRQMLPDEVEKWSSARCAGNGPYGMATLDLRKSHGDTKLREFIAKTCDGVSRAQAKRLGRFYVVFGSLTVSPLTFKFHSYKAGDGKSSMSVDVQKNSITSSWNEDNRAELKFQFEGMDDCVEYFQYQLNVIETIY